MSICGKFEVPEYQIMGMDLKIANRGKDYFIEQMQGERKEFITKIETNSRMIGEIETKLLQLEEPREQQDPKIKNGETEPILYSEPIRRENNDSDMHSA